MNAVVFYGCVIILVLTAGWWAMKNARRRDPESYRERCDIEDNHL